jgi:hypothetical protein
MCREVIAVLRAIQHTPKHSVDRTYNFRIINLVCTVIARISTVNTSRIVTGKRENGFKEKEAITTARYGLVLVLYNSVILFCLLRCISIAAPVPVAARSIA